MSEVSKTFHSAEEVLKEYISDYEDVDNCEDGNRSVTGSELADCLLEPMKESFRDRGF